MQALGLTGGPLGEQDGARIFPAKEGTQGLLEGATEQHRRTGVLLLPAIEVAMAIAPRAGEVLADLSVAVGHVRPPVGCPDLPVKAHPSGRLKQSRQGGAGKRR